MSQTDPCPQKAYKKPETHHKQNIFTTENQLCGGFSEQLETFRTDSNTQKWDQEQIFYYHY